MEDIVVSICCMTYNHGAFVRDCFDGFLKQKVNFRYEVLVHDDASTDGTIDIILEYQREYPDIFKPYIQKENQYSKGEGALNTRYNFNRAKGKYIAWCEGDDYWIDPSKLQKQVDFLENNPLFVMCAHPVNHVDEKNNIIRLPDLSNRVQTYSKKDIFHVHFPTLSVVFRNVDLTYPKDLPYLFNGDALLFAMLSTHGEAALLNFIGANYRVHGGGVYSSNSLLKNQVKSIKSRRKMLKSSYFEKWQKKELIKEIFRRKAIFSFDYLKRGKLVNITKLLFS